MDGASLTPALLTDLATRSSAVGSMHVHMHMLRLPAGPTIARPSGPAEPRMLHLLLPVDSAVAVKVGRGMQHVVGPRALGWLPGWTGCALFTAHPVEAAIVTVPASVLDTRVALSAPLPSAPASGSRLVEPARAFLQTALAGEHALDALAAPLFDEMLAALLESLVTEARAHQTAAFGHPRLEQVPPPLRMRAIAQIAAHRSDPALSPQQIARSLRISVRQLQRAFEEAGCTVAGEIRRQRMEAAIGMLTDEVFDRLTISEIALRAGFRNDAELRRALLAVAGTTPSRLRVRHPVPA